MIPQIIHQTWKGPPDTIPEHWLASYEGWNALKGWTYMYWDDAAIDKLIADHYPWFLEKFRGYAHGIQRADTFRYFVLHKYGGVYSDLDICPKSNFQTFFETVKHEDVAIAANKEGNSFAGENLTNAFMMSQPRSAFWPHVWTFLIDPFKRKAWKRAVAQVTYYFRILFTTGPGIINDSAATYDGEVYRIPGSLTQPGDDNTPKPLSTRESVVTILDGSSWHRADAKFFKAMGDVVNNIQWVWLALFIFSALVAIVFIYLWWKNRKELRGLRQRKNLFNDHDPNNFKTK